MKNLIKIIPVVVFYSAFVDPLAAAPEEKDKATKVQKIDYVVKQNDTLTSIAKTYLKDATKWRKILEFNQIDNPNLIQPGLKISIPIELYKKPLGQVAKKTGSVNLKAYPNNSWAKLSTGRDIFVKDGVETQKKSQVDIKLMPESNLTVLPSSLIFFEINLTRKLKRHRLLLQRGRIFSKHNRSRHQVKLKKRGKKLKWKPLIIRTPSARIAVKGTEFLTSVGKDDTTEMVTVNGMVAVTGVKKTVLVPKGHQTTVKKGKDPTPPVPIPQALELQLSH